ncbi:MAG: flippase-like domain-containing protein, partial [Acidimicrobiales bacterium]
MLAVLLPRGLRLLVPAWNPSDAAWLAAALAATLGGVVLAALRWQRVLAALDEPTPVRPLVSHYLAGLFVSNFLPSTIGGDLVRVQRLSASGSETPRAFASVVLERLTGWVVLPVISLVTLAINPGLLRPPIDQASKLVLVLSVATLLT